MLLARSLAAIFLQTAPPPPPDAPPTPAPAPTTPADPAALPPFSPPPATTPASPPTSVVTPAAEPAPSAPAPILGPKFDEAYVDRINRNYRGFGLGFDQGLWGHGFGQTLKILIPFGKRVGQFFGLRLRGIAVYDVTNNPLDTAFAGGLELFGRSPVYLGLVRIYGGGGLWAGGRPFRPASDSSRGFGVAGGGHFGVEFVLTSRVGMTIELGGKSPVHALGLDAGATVTGGMMVYLGNLRGRG